MLKLRGRFNTAKSNRFCSNCGAKLGKNVKFCPSCGHATSGRGGSSAQAGEKLPKLWKLFLLLFAVVFFGSIFGFIYMIPEGSTPASDLLIIEILSAGMFILGVVQMYRQSFKILQRKTKLRLLTVSLVFAFMPFFIGYVITASYYGHRLQMVRFENYINNYLVDAASAKLAGNQAKTSDQLKRVVTFEKIVSKELKTLSPPRSLKNYYAAASQWVNSLANAKTVPQWRKISAFPKYQLNVSSATKKYLINNALADINDMRPFGDAIIASGVNNRGNMAFISGRLVAEEGLLKALGGSKRFCMRRNKANICTDKVINSVKAVQTAAADYTIGKDQFGEKWNIATKNLIKLFKPVGYKAAYTIAGTQAEDTNMTVAPRVDKFWAGCYGLKGSALIPTFKNRLPTMESGYSCYYTSNGDSCWGFLTLSGREFGGSSNGVDSINCRQQNLPSMPPKVNSKFDGVYSLFSNGAVCSTGESTDLFAEPRISKVKNNAVDSGSSVQITIDASGFGGVTYSDSGAKVAISEQYDQFGAMQGFWKITTDKGDCAGSFVGIKK